MTVYKVVLKSENQFSSFKTSGYSLTYKIGEKTVPKIGKIFVFKMFQDAYDFLTFCKSTKYLAKLGQYTILVGETDKISKILNVSYVEIPITNDQAYIEALYHSNNISIETFWKAKKQHKKSSLCTYQTPNTSFVCDSFIPSFEYNPFTTDYSITYDNTDNKKGTFFLKASLNKNGLDIIRDIWGNKKEYYLFHMWGVGVFKLIGAKTEKLQILTDTEGNVQFKLWVNFDELVKLTEDGFPKITTPTLTVNNVSNNFDLNSIVQIPMIFSKIDLTIWNN